MGQVLSDDATFVRGLGPPFDSWNVAVEPQADNARVLTVSFDSAALGLRAVSLVYVPDNYSVKGRPIATAYFLHGTAGGSDSPARMITGGTDAGSGAVQQIENLHFETTLDRQQFLIVAPDADPEVVWCGTCLWIDGRGDGAIAAETHLLRELIPLTEALFNVRTDRGGRGLLGNSMGGSGAMIQAYRHPDLFAITVPFSPAADLINHPGAAAFIGAVGYLRSQGYGDPVQGEIFYRNFNPMDLATNALGTGVETLMVIGDGCLTSNGQGNCADRPPEDAPANAGVEAFGRNIDDAASTWLDEIGLPYSIIRREGIHGGHYEDTYKRFFLDRINAVFSDEVPAPHRFSYKTVDNAFSIWDYTVAIDRPNNEFLNILGVRRDGRGLRLAGTGIATVTTPKTFKPRGIYRVVVTPDGGQATESAVRADETGRLSLTIDLGPTRTTDERKTMITAGLFVFPHTTVEVFDR